MFRETKLGEGQLGCAEGPMLGQRNAILIQHEKSWSCMVFILAKYQIFLESYCEDGDLNYKWISVNDKGSSH